MAEDGKDSSTLKTERVTVDHSPIRRDLASQIRRHKTPNLRLAEKLEEVADSGKPEVVFSKGYQGQLKIETPGSELPDEIGIQFMETIKSSVPRIIDMARLGSGEMSYRKGDTRELLIGERLLRKKVDHITNKKVYYESKFKGLIVSQAKAEELIKDIMQDDMGTVIARDETIDVFNSQGQGITLRVLNGEWFLQSFTDAASYINPRNLRPNNP